MAAVVPCILMVIFLATRLALKEHVSSRDLRSDPQWHSLLLPDSLVEKVRERQILYTNTQQKTQ